MHNGIGFIPKVRKAKQHQVHDKNLGKTHDPFQNETRVFVRSIKSLIIMLIISD